MLLTFGIWGDSAGFWTSKPYLTNTFSALTGAAFGIPLALVVLQRVAASEADSAEARAAHRMAVRVSADLASAVAALVKGGVPKVREAKLYLENQRDTIPNRSYISLGVWDDIKKSDFPLQWYIDTLETILTHINKLLDPKKTQLLAEVSAQWSILNTESRSRLLETGGKWLTGLEVKELNRLVTKVAGPTLETWLQEGSSLLELLHFEERRSATDDSYSHIVADVPTRFDRLFEEIISFFGDTAELITASTAAAQTLASSQFS